MSELPAGVTEAQLKFAMDKAKSQVFLSNSAAFMAPLMCGMSFHWDSEISQGTAATDGTNLWWCPKFFWNLPEKTRETVLMHELYHPGRLHSLRRNGRHPKVWNYACDIRINNDLENEGYSFIGIEWAWKNQAMDAEAGRRLAEEEIYDLLMEGAVEIPQLPGGSEGDLREPTKEEMQKIVANVVRAAQQAKMSGNPHAIPGGVEKAITKFLTPVVPWEAELYEFFSDLQETCYSWSRPNRRYVDMYMPSEVDDEGRLAHLAYFLDISGSITSADELRFASEVKYIKDTFNPRKLTLVQFHTRIAHERCFGEDDPFDEVVIMGTGGTCLKCVHAWIEKNQPTCAIIFSDMQVAAMEPLDPPIPVIWVASAGGGHTPTFGRYINIARPVL